MTQDQAIDEEDDSQQETRERNPRHQPDEPNEKQTDGKPNRRCKRVQQDPARLTTD